MEVSGSGSMKGSGGSPTKGSRKLSFRSRVVQCVLKDGKRDTASMRRKKRLMNRLSGSGVDSNMEKLIMHSYEEQGTPNAGMSQEAVTQMIDFGRTPQEIPSD